MTSYNYCTQSGYKSKTYNHKERIKRERVQEFKVIHEEIICPPHIQEAIKTIRKLEAEKDL